MNKLAKREKTAKRSRLSTSDWLILLAGSATISALTFMGYQYVTGAPRAQWTTAQAHLDVQVPKLSERATRGETVFAQNCRQCHGQHAAGSNQGPPLINRIYEPSHHGNEAFHRAVRRGVKRHHWQYGNMPAIGGVANDSVGEIIAYVRELQRANGIR